MYEDSVTLVEPGSRRTVKYWVQSVFDLAFTRSKLVICLVSNRVLQFGNLPRMVWCQLSSYIERVREGA